MTRHRPWILAGLVGATLVVATLTVVLMLSGGSPPDGGSVAVLDRSSGKPTGLDTERTPLTSSTATGPNGRQQARAARPAAPKLDLPFLKGLVTEAASGRPVRDFRVWVLPHEASPPLDRLGDVTPLRIRDSSGIFRAREEPGRYDLVVEAPGFVPAWETDLAIPSTDRKPVEFALETGAGIDGLLLADTGLPAPNVTLFLEATYLPPGSKGPPMSLARSDREGRFRFSPLDPGTYAVTPLAPDNRTDRIPAIQVAAGRLTPAEIHLSSRHQVTLQIRDLAGRPVADAQVELTGNGHMSSGRSTPAGLVVLNHLDDGTYALSVACKGFLPLTQELELSGGFGLSVHWVSLSRPPP